MYNKRSLIIENPASMFLHNSFFFDPFSISSIGNIIDLVSPVRLEPARHYAQNLNQDLLFIVSVFS